MHFILQKNSKTSNVLHAFLSLVVAKLSDLKNSPGFLAHPVDICPCCLFSIPRCSLLPCDVQYICDADRLYLIRMKGIDSI